MRNATFARPRPMLSWTSSMARSRSAAMAAALARSEASWCSRELAIAMAAWVAKRCSSCASAASKRRSSAAAKTMQAPIRSALSRIGTPITPRWKRGSSESM